MDNQKRQRRSIRLRGYDYSRPGACFVTVCTRDRACIFGEVVDGHMRLSAAGRSVQEAWDAIPQHHPGVRVDAFVVMPNHIHGIIVVGTDVGLDVGVGVGARHAAPSGMTRAHHDAPLRETPPQPDPPPGSLGAIVRAFKSAAARHINQQRGTPGAPIWQRNYYERVVRDDDELDRIRQYILDNPSQWALDMENPRFAVVGAPHAAPPRPE